MAKDNFNIIYERNYQRSFMFAKSYVHDDMIAEDIVSDSLVKYWRLISTQKGEATEALLLSILRNKALDYLRHKAVHDAAIENLEEIKKRELSIRISTLEACDPEEIFREEIRTILQRTLQSLPSQDIRDESFRKQNSERNRYRNQPHRKRSRIPHYQDFKSITYQSKRLSSLILFSFFLTFLVFPLGIYLAASFIIYKAKLIDTMKELLQRYIKGEVSEKERLKIASWLDESPENMREFLVLRKLYDISLWQANTDKTNSVKKVHYSIRKIMAEILKIAAIFLIGFWGSKQLQIQQSNKKQMQTIHVPAGQRAEVTLADGTHVWLNSRSTLKFPEQFSANTRNVELDGEGYFSVQHNENSPFTVHTQNHDVQVLGTEFNVKAYHNTSLFETALLKGSVKISSPNLRNGLQLKPNEIVSIENRMLKKSTINNSDYFKWKEGLFCFENESIQDLIKKLELYYDTTIEIQRPSLLKHHYSGKFRIQDGIEHVLKVLQLKHKFTYIKDDDKNLIIIK